MQSDGNCFPGDVVLNTFKMVYRDKDSILDKKIWEIKYFGIFEIFIMKILNFKEEAF